MIHEPSEIPSAKSTIARRSQLLTSTSFVPLTGQRWSCRTVVADGLTMAHLFGGLGLGMFRSIPWINGNVHGDA